MFKFIIEHQDSRSGARAGRLITPHGEIETPIFMPVGTIATVKSLDCEDLTEIGAQIILGNTYHLYVRPGMELMKQAGGLHKFMNWNGPILTDSGGFQVYSLESSRKITEEGAFFQSHVNGDRILFTPESVIRTERIIGADIIMPFDECIAHPCEKKDAENAMKRTHRWLNRSIDEHKRLPSEQALFGIIQGSVFDDLRSESAEFVSNTEVDGIAIGGLSVGEPAEMMYHHTGLISKIVDRQRPLYLMGVGMPDNIIESVHRGVDMFDCVVPTRHARNGQVFTSRGRVHYKAGEYKAAFDRPFDENCDCYVCKNYSLGYMRHLFSCGEMTAMRLASYHNIYFYVHMMKKMRQAILEDRFPEWRNEWLMNMNIVPRD